MLLTAAGVVFGYGGPPLLQGVSLRVRSGESVAVMGPSGSGKTTLLGLLGGVLTPHAGTVELLDPDGEALPLAASVSWVLQTVNVLADRSVGDNVALGAYADGCTHAEALDRARPALDAVGLAGRIEQSARELSGGELQRVVIARSLISHRPVILADEPTGQLDHATSATVVDALVAAAAGRILVVVTHDPDVAGACDRRLALRDGALVQA